MSAKAAASFALAVQVSQTQHAWQRLSETPPAPGAKVRISFKQPSTSGLLAHPPRPSQPLQAFKRGEDAAKIFFVDVSFDSSRDLFKRLGIQGLPMVFHWGPSAVAKKKMTLSDSRKVKTLAAGLLCDSNSSGSQQGAVGIGSRLFTAIVPFKHPWPAHCYGHSQCLSGRGCIASMLTDSPPFIPPHCGCCCCCCSWLYMLQCGAGIQEYPWPAEELLSCFVGKSQLKADKVTRPSILTHPLFPLFAAAFVLTGAYTAWRLYNSPLLRYTALWAVGGLVVFWFSTSGGMYNIIRNVPLYIHRDGKIVWWMQVRRQGSAGQQRVQHGVRSHAPRRACYALHFWALAEHTDSSRVDTSSRDSQCMCQGEPTPEGLPKHLHICMSARVAACRCCICQCLTSRLHRA